MGTSTEQSIMDAAEAEFMEKGFAAAKTTAIARRAGVTHAMLHYYFRTKENLFDQVFRKKVELLADSIDKAFGGEGAFIAKMRRGVGAHFDFLVENPRLPLFVLREIVDAPERRETVKEVLLPVFGRVVGHLQELFDRESAGGNIVPVTALEIVLNIVSMNVFAIASLPLTLMLAGKGEGERAEFLQARREQIIEQVLARLTNAEGGMS